MGKRCNDYWTEAVTHFAGTDTGDAVRQFTYGFICGQAEKVHAGACQAAMSAPLNEDADWTRAAVEKIAAVYGLATYEYRRARRTEFWLLRPDFGVVDKLAQRINDNIYRALICGIPWRDIDRDYVIEAP